MSASERTEPRFAFGDRVSRDLDVWGKKIRPRAGTVVQVYGKRSKRFGIYQELYDVQFDDGKLETGFLRHGIDPL